MGLMFTYVELDKTIQVTRDGIANGNLTDFFFNGTSLEEAKDLQAEAEMWLHLVLILVIIDSVLLVVSVPLSCYGFALFNYFTTFVCAVAVTIVSILLLPFTERVVATIIDTDYVTSNKFLLYGAIAINVLYLANAVLSCRNERLARKWAHLRASLIEKDAWTEEDEKEYETMLYNRDNLAFMYDTMIVPLQRKLGLKPMEEEEEEYEEKDKLGQSTESMQ